MSTHALRSALTLAVFMAAALSGQMTAHAEVDRPIAPAEVQPAVRLTLDAARNAALARSLDRSLAVVERRLAGQLCHRLGAKSPQASRPDHCRGDDLPAPFITVVLRDGDIARLVMRNGASLERPFPMGSITKLVLGVPALALENAAIDEHWCPRAVAGLRNASGFEGVTGCEQRADLLPARKAMATSDNLAWAWRLAQIAPERLGSHMRRAGVTLPDSQVAPAVAMALGMASLSPRQVLECHEALLTGRSRRASIVAVGTAEPMPIANWCATAAGRASRRGFVETMLHAPLGSGGTASFLPPMGQRVEWLSAKTGTATTDDTLDSAKVLLFSLRSNGHRYTVLIGLASPRPNWPFGKRVASAELRPLVESVLADIVTAPTPRATRESMRAPDQPARRRP